MQALLARSRTDELELLAAAGPGDEPAEAVGWLWRRLADPARADLLRLWAEGYVRSMVEPDGPWGGFAARGVEDWLTVLGEVFDPTDATAVLAVLRGAMLDLLATGDVERTTVAVHRQLALLTR